MVAIIESDSFFSVILALPGRKLPVVPRRAGTSEARMVQWIFSTLHSVYLSTQLYPHKGSALITFLNLGVDRGPPKILQLVTIILRARRFPLLMPCDTTLHLRTRTKLSSI